jgi:hypothetical protein
MFVENPEELGMNGRIVLEWSLKSQGWKKWTGFLRFVTGTTGEFFVNKIVIIWVPQTTGNFLVF